MTADIKEWCLANISNTQLQIFVLDPGAGDPPSVGGGNTHCNIVIGITAPALAEILCTAPLFTPDILGMWMPPKKLCISDLFWHLPCLSALGLEPRALFFLTPVPNRQSWYGSGFVP